VDVKKGNTIQQFIETVRRQLVGEFTELRTMSSDHLLYVKEDMIIPHVLLFYFRVCVQFICLNDFECV
jgi:protein FAM50